MYTLIFEVSNINRQMRAPEVTIAAVVVFIEVRCCVEVCFPKILPPCLEQILYERQPEHNLLF